MKGGHMKALAFFFGMVIFFIGGCAEFNGSPLIPNIIAVFGLLITYFSAKKIDNL